jgi:phosphoglycerate dehydrogenase-like enzyme
LTQPSNATTHLVLDREAGFIIPDFDRDVITIMMMPIRRLNSRGTQGLSIVGCECASRPKLNEFATRREQVKVLVGRSEELKQSIRDAGYEVIDAPPAQSRGSQALPALLNVCGDADVALSVNLPRAAMLQAPKLRAIITTSIGIERIDVAVANDLGILVCNSPSPENFNGVAEATVGLLVALSKQLKRKEASLRLEGWGIEADRGILLMGRTLGLVGLGRIGSGVAQRLAGWGMRIIAYDPYVRPEIAVALGVTLVELTTLFRESDFVSVHLLVTPETQRLIGEDLFRMMKPQAYLVNTSRGQVFDEAALELALRERWIAGAALDVFESEPLAPDSPLRDLDPDQMILTPHNVSHTWESQAGGRRMAIESTLSILQGNVPETVVNPEAIPIWRKRFSS